MQIDEYQDINPIKRQSSAHLQEQPLHSGRRQAEHLPFPPADTPLPDKYHSETRRWARQIDLSSNFRSRPVVLKESSIRLFTGGLAVDYPPEAHLIAGREFGDSLGLALGEGPIEVYLLSGDPDPEEAVDTLEREAALIASRIKELVQGGYVIRDKEGYRPITYGDVAVLLRTTRARANTFQEVFQRAGIPVYAERDGYCGGGS